MKDRDTEIFSAFVSEEDIKKEKSEARKLRCTRWWHQKCIKGICYYCGSHMRPSDLTMDHVVQDNYNDILRGLVAFDLTMDHVVPLIRGGKSVKNNLVPACKECNNKKNICCPWSGKSISRGGRSRKW